MIGLLLLLRNLVKEIKPMKYVELSRKLKKHHIMMKKI